MTATTKPSPFNVGDHVRYVGAHNHALPAGQGNGTEPLLAAGMEGVILLSSGALSEGTTVSSPWHGRVQFENGYQLDITPENVSDFEAHDEDATAW